MEEICPYFENCPIFDGGDLKKKCLKMQYRQQYCEAGKSNYTACKRFKVSEITKGPVPIRIMPNSMLSIEEISEMISVLRD